ncbi:acyl-CoA/acyl-ACP dehydrogenase [Nocardiopsis sp. CNT-189]|uniref:acyl-CoA dehydrogenase family protein n=1 Tax=Nocardiopsis oceanisediminis TaxID=2816862 RepID=UPI003B365D8A
MRFTLDSEQRLFAETVRGLLSGADACGAARAWGRGDRAPGRALWRALADAGVFALAVPEEHGGAGVRPVELVAALIEVGRHGVPGPVVETLAAARVLGDPEALAGIADGSLSATLALPPVVPYALDADAADLVLAVHGGALHRAGPDGGPRRSLDPARRLFSWSPAGEVPCAAASPAAAAAEFGALACAAQALGAGRRLLDATAEHVRTREQFGRPIGAFQAVQHRLADTLIELEFAGSLVYGAAVAHGGPDAARDASAAKAAASEAAYRAARTALQLHGAIGYTDEFDLSLWIRKARALHTAWGSPAHHRGRVMAALTGE